MTNDELKTIERILDRHIPKGTENMNCHSGITMMEKCSRCNDAKLIRNLIAKAVLEGAM